MKTTTLALIGAGNRGRGIFGAYALTNPHRAKFVAVVEPDAAKRERFAEDHAIPAENRFANCRELFARGRLAEGAVIATIENQRFEPTEGAMKQGYDILIEKPLGLTAQDVIRLCDAARSYRGIFIVCHQMRHVAPYAALKSMIASGRYGRIISVEHSENLSYEHMAHSFVRGFFSQSRLTPMILAKCCHDMDILRYLVDSRPRRLASFGALTHFRSENAPEGAPAYCLEGCPAESTCPYHVQKVYFRDDTDPAYIRQMGVVTNRRDLLELLRTNQFGRCVYRCDNDVVDHQVVALEFENGATASFRMVGLNGVERRMTRVSMEKAELSLDLVEGVIHVWTYGPERQKLSVEPLSVSGTHHGGDVAIMDAFIQASRTGNKQHVLTPVAASLESHLMAFAAEEARVTGRVVDLEAFEAACRARRVGDGKGDGK